MVAPSSRIASVNGSSKSGASSIPGAAAAAGRATSAQPVATTTSASGSSSSLLPPRRAPSPSQAAFSSTSRIPAAGGAAAGSRLPGPASAGSRFGFGGGSTAGPASSSIKRPFSAVGSSSESSGPSKRLASALNATQQRATALPPRPSSRASVASSTGSGPALDVTNTSSTQAVAPPSSTSSASKVPDHLLSGPPSESAEYMLSVMKNEYERRSLVHRQELAALEKQLGGKVRELSRAEKRASEVLDEWEREREERAEKDDEARAAQERLGGELEEVRKSYTALLGEHEALQATHSTLATQTESELGSLRLAKAQWDAERVQLEEEAKLAREAQVRAEEEREALEKVLEEEAERTREVEERARATASGWGSREEAEAVEKEIKRQAIHIQGLEATIEKLRQENKFHTDTATNIELLREEKRSLESKLRGMEDLRQALAAAEAGAIASAEENAAWKNAVEGVLRSGPDASRVADLLETQEVIVLPEFGVAQSDGQEGLTPPIAQAQLSNVLNVLAALHTRASIQASSLAELRARLTELEESGAQHAQERDARGRELAEVKASLTRAERAEQRSRAELGRYREMLDSYEAERIKFQNGGGGGSSSSGHEDGATTAAAAAGTADTKGGVGDAEGDDLLEDDAPPAKVEDAPNRGRSSVGPSSEASLARIASLEGLVDELRAQCESVSVELEGARREVARLEEALSLASVDTGAAAKVKELNKALEGSKAEYEQLFKDAEALSKENDKLLERVGRGEFDTTKEKCWTLNKTPASEHFAVRTAQLEALKKENEDLLKRLDEVNSVAAAAPLPPTSADSAAATNGEQDTAAESGAGSGAGALVPRQVVENFKKDIQDLNKSIQAKDKAMLRLKQVFNKKATEFREVIQSLFGYKIRFLENGKVKLSSVYALSSKGRGTNIIFQSHANNTAQMQLLLGDGDVEGAGGLKDLQWLKEYWLGEERHNVPCFLAALSKELYEAVTRVEKRSAWRMEIGEDEGEEDRPAPAAGGQRDGDGDAVMHA
ncbi:coiled-coil domain-containing protein mad1 [Tilletia horrida]|uniref:Spindle assembly checkpoint component MAD1 n=1 Tax=Tilletia horrida TaxID=155126 RepID=A0AAN6GTA2_9BASI|nr:coiled-coil domain-containing protein mad1 [Tilletia horrida]KAK0555287.1 coiled-coil domain-containing protein mad1 [Tilletia horrida]